MQKISYYIPFFFTLSRIVITPIILFALHTMNFQGLVIAQILFLYALLSDFLDGFFARKYDAETEWGAFLDPLADKILLWPLMGYMSWVGLLNQWILFVFIVRDIFVTFLRSKAKKNNLLFVTSFWAKRKTALQFFIIFLGILLLIAQKIFLPQAIQASLLAFMNLSTILALVASLSSAFYYLTPELQRKLNLFCLYFICTAGGVGLIPFMPGTWGTLVGLFCYQYILSADAILSSLFVLCVIGIAASHELSSIVKLKDPGFIVIDEVVGFLLAALLVMPGSAFELLLLFLLFRLFDILKPWPIILLERLPGGVGIVTDDLGAGFAAAVSFKILLMISTIFV